MKYIKLFFPIPVSFLIIFLSESYLDGPNKIVATVVKGGLLIYYLRLDNSKTPLINTLTIIILAMTVGEYLLHVNTLIGQIVFIISAIAFGLFFFFRQKLKDEKDKLMKLKITAVLIFVLVSILSMDSSMSLIPLGIGTIFLAFVYFYDRLTLGESSKKVRV